MFPLAPPLLRSFSWNPAPIIIKLPAHEDSPLPPMTLESVLDGIAGRPRITT